MHYQWQLGTAITTSISDIDGIELEFGLNKWDKLHGIFGEWHITAGNTPTALC